MEELKCCPFRGGEAQLYFDGVDGSFVKRTNCGAMGQKFPVSRRYGSDASATEAWNRRIESDRKKRRGWC